MTSKVLAALALCATLFATTSAHADESLPEPAVEADKPQTAQKRWYGYQTLATDAASVALLGLAIAADDNGTAQTGFLVASGATYAIAPGVVHGVHGNPGRAVGDVAIRVFAPVVTTGVGALLGVATSDRDLGSQLGGVLVGGLIGFVTGVAGAMALDATVLAYDSSPAGAEKKPAKTGASIAPSFGPTKNGFAAGLSGTF